MIHPSVRFTVRGMMVVVALLALNLGAALATSRYHPLPRSPVVGVGDNRGVLLTRSDGSVLFTKGVVGKPRQVRLIRPPLPPAWRFWSPVLAAATATLMVLAIAAGWPRMPAARWAVVLVLLALSMMGVRWWWVLDGGDLPLGRLRLGLTKPEVREIVGPPDPEGSTEDSWLITRPGSLYWLEIRFDREGRLNAFPPNSHLSRYHPAYRKDLFK